MACYAIYGGVVLLVALNAEPHGVIDFSLGYRHGVQVAVAGGAIDAGANVRGVIELHVRGRLEAVDALPGNFFAARFIGGEFLDFGFVRGDDLMASHAEADARDACVRTLIDTGVAESALQSLREVNFVRISDGLHRSGTHAEKFLHGIGDAAVFDGENGRRLRRCRRLRGRARILGEQRTNGERPPEDDHAENGNDTYRATHTGRSQRPRTLVKEFSAGGLHILHAHPARVNPEFEGGERTAFLKQVHVL
jgi:hypothetical protein